MTDFDGKRITVEALARMHGVHFEGWPINGVPCARIYGKCYRLVDYDDNEQTYTLRRDAAADTRPVGMQPLLTPSFYLTLYCLRLRLNVPPLPKHHREARHGY